MTSGCFKVKLPLLFTLAMCCCTLTSQAAAPSYEWELAPYRIHTLIAVDVFGNREGEVAAGLASHLDERVRTAIGPAWLLETEIATGPLRHQLLRDIESTSKDEMPQPPPGTDKRLLLAVRAMPYGYELSAREYDDYVQRWGATIRRPCRQRAELPEQVFRLVRDVFAPLARIELDPNDARRVILRVRGAELPRASADSDWVRAGDVFAPIWRRTTREGEVVPGGIQQVPWTYVEAADVDGEDVVGRMYSGTRRPLGVRHRGRIEQLALALRNEPGDTVLQLHSRTDADKPLVGYEVFVQNTDQQTTELIGRSDREGNVIVHPGKTRIQMLYVKSGGFLLARVPVVPGAEARLGVPLPDDDLRLQAEARLTALREDLVDVVARRNILMARIRQKMEENDYPAAKELLGELDQLPGRAYFNRELTMEARLHRGDDPMVQKRIDELFTATQRVLGEFLDGRPVSELHDQLRERERGGS